MHYFIQWILPAGVGQTTLEAVICLRPRVIRGGAPGSVLISFPLNWNPNRHASSKYSKQSPDAGLARFLRRKKIQIRRQATDIAVDLNRVSHAHSVRQEPLPGIGQPPTEGGPPSTFATICCKNSVNPRRLVPNRTHLSAPKSAPGCTRFLAQNPLTIIRIQTIIA